MKLLDTTFLIHYWSGNEDAGSYLAAHDDTDEFVTTPINLMRELAVGRRRQGQFDARELDATFGWVTVVPFDAEQAYEAARLEADLLGVRPLPAAGRDACGRRAHRGDRPCARRADRDTEHRRLCPLRWGDCRAVLTAGSRGDAPGAPDRTPDPVLRRRGLVLSASRFDHGRRAAQTNVSGRDSARSTAKPWSTWCRTAWPRS